MNIIPPFMQKLHRLWAINAAVRIKPLLPAPPETDNVENSPRREKKMREKVAAQRRRRPFSCTQKGNHRKYALHKSHSSQSRLPPPANVSIPASRISAGNPHRRRLSQLPGTHEIFENDAQF